MTNDFKHHNDPSFNKDWNDIRHWFGDKRHFRPWYDDDADYNTNAKSYYDFLARFIRQLDTMIGLINKLLDQDINVEDTASIDLTKTGDWQDGYMCNGEWRDGTSIEILKADLIVSKQKLNALQVLDDGAYVKDLEPEIEEIRQEITNLDQRITKVENNLDAINNALYTILKNLQGSGAYTPSADGKPSQQLPDNDTLVKIFNGTFINGHDLATGNINLFGGKPDGNSFIRTNNGSTENDVTAGIE